MFETVSVWSILWYVFLLLYVPACLGLIGIVLLQKGKGMGMGGAFGMGGGGGDTVFGPRLARTLPQKLTYAAAAIFMVLALTMSMLAGRLNRGIAPELVQEGEIANTMSVEELFDDNAPATDGTVTTPEVVIEMPADDAAATSEVAPQDAAAPTAAELMPAPVVEEAAPAGDASAAVEETATPEAAPVETPATETPAPTPAQ